MNKAEIADSPIKGGFNVEQIGSDGECYVTIFTGPAAEERAIEYAAWLNSRTNAFPSEPDGRVNYGG